MMRNCVYLERVPIVIGGGLYVGAEVVGDAVGSAVTFNIIIILYLSKVYII